MRCQKLSFALLLLGCLLALAGVDAAPAETSPDPRFRLGGLLWKDDFDAGSGQWFQELEKGGKVEAREGKLEIDVPGGCTVWFRHVIEGPVLIQYDAVVINAGGANDRTSDLNCFWMARDSRASDDLLGFRRNGQFSDYNALCTYYVGLGGNSNTTTRFRRYIGDAEQRPLLPEHDLRDPKHLLVANARQNIRLVACGPLIQFYRDDERVFELDDPAPYQSGWFGFRTVGSHLEVSNFRVYRLQPVPAAP